MIANAQPFKVGYVYEYAFERSLTFEDPYTYHDLTVQPGDRFVCESLGNGCFRNEAFLLCVDGRRIWAYAREYTLFVEM